jgi:hypothetical protein
VHMFVNTFIRICWSARLCAYVCEHIYVHMLVSTFMYLCWSAHLCAYVGEHINSKHNARFESYSNPESRNLPSSPTNYVVPHTSVAPDCNVPFLS